MIRPLLALTVFCLALSACSPSPLVPSPLPPSPAAVTPPPAPPAEPPTLSPSPTAPASIPAAASSIHPRYGLPGDYAADVLFFTLGAGDEQISGAVVYPQPASAPTPGPYPLVVYSVGLAGSGYDALPLLRTIASHGFVGITWTPRGESLTDFWAGAAARPLDLQRLIAYAEELNAPGGKLAGLIDTAALAVAGHSSGGWTALQAGGAQMDLDWCDQADLVAQLPFGNCPQFVPHQADIAAMLGLPAAPQGLWPPIYDPRVDAVIALAPDGDLWGKNYAGVGSVKVPTLVMAGADDSMNIPDLTAYPIYAHLGGPHKALAIFAGADHDLGWYMYADQLDHLIVAFLLANLKGDPAAAAALLPANVNFRGVKYAAAPP